MIELNPVDAFIRRLVIGASVLGVMGLLTAGTVVMVLVSANFNILNWME